MGKRGGEVQTSFEGSDCTVIMPEIGLPETLSSMAASQRFRCPLRLAPVPTAHRPKRRVKADAKMTARP